jgi:hypothetical protein
MSRELTHESTAAHLWAVCKRRLGGTKFDPPPPGLNPRKDYPAPRLFVRDCSRNRNPTHDIPCAAAGPFGAGLVHRTKFRAPMHVSAL